MKIGSWWRKAGLVLAVAVLAWGLSPATVRAGTKAQIGVEQAKVMFSDKDYDGALARLKEALAEEPQNGEALQYAGLCELGLKRPAEAIEYLEQAAAVMPQNPGVEEDLAWAALTAQRYDLALTASNKALALEPGRARATLYKGQALLGLKRNEEALAALGDVATGTQYSQAANFYSGTALLGLGRTEEAVGFFKTAQSLGPETEIGKKSGEYLGTLGGTGGPAKKDWSARVRLLYQYDTNIVTVAGDEYLPADISHMADSRGVLDADLAWHFINTAKARASVRYVGYANFQFEQTAMNLQYHLGELSGYYVVPAGSAKVKLGAAADYSWAALEGSPYMTSWKATPYLEIGWTKSSLTGIDVEYGGEEFNNKFGGVGSSSAFADRDNTRTHVTLRQTQALAGGKLNLLAGYRWGRVYAEGAEYIRDDNGVFAGLQAALPAESRLSFLLRYDDRLYPVNSFDRHDRLLVGNLSYEIPIFEALHFYTGVVYTNVDSNLSVLEYDRWIFSLGLVAEL